MPVMLPIRRPRSTAVALAIASALLGGIDVTGVAAGRAGQSVLAPSGSVTTPFAGVIYIDRIATDPRPLHMHVIQVDTTTPGIRFQLSPPRGPDEVLRQTTLEYVRESGAQVGINAHFFLPWPSTDLEAHVIGLAASDGVVYSECETPSQRYALVDRAPAVNIGRDNRVSVVACEALASTDASAAARASLWTTVSGSAQIVTNGRVTIPRYRDDSHPDDVLEPGGPSNYANARSWYDALNARTAIGISRDGRIVTLFTVDVRGGSAGMTIPEVAAMLVRDYGVWHALNLDGGGSTSMVIADPLTGVPALVNASSDNPGGRAVGSSLVVFAAPARLR